MQSHFLSPPTFPLLSAGFIYGKACHFPAITLKKPSNFKIYVKSRCLILRILGTEGWDRVS